ncbi:MAG: outer membrane beta-barrel protein [Myxococcota bacterium]
MMTGLLIAWLAGASANAAENGQHEVSIEMGSIGAYDTRWDAFSSREQMNTLGARGGLALTPRWSMLLDAQLGLNGSNVDIDAEDEGTGEFVYQADAFSLDLGTLQVGLGPKFTVPLKPWLRTYGTVQAMGMLGRMRMDDDPDEDGRRRYWSATPGGAAAVGGELVVGDASQGIVPAMHLELGYAYMASMQFSDRSIDGEPAPIGALDFRGFYLRWGLGVRF